ncbi:MAG: ChaN family lipoprotein [Candidatus Sedimenticola sp. (ex Thyasira tokunagai)]
MMKKNRLFSALLLISLVALLSACATVGVHGQEHKPLPVNHGTGETDVSANKPADVAEAMEVLDMSRQTSLDDIGNALLEKRVIFVGETHDNYAHHLKQLEVIEQIHRGHTDIAIGMEMFQRPFQQILDAYIAGDLDEQEFLRKSEWFERWRYDYRLYRPIIQYARENGIPLVALNASAEIKRRVSEVGFAGLTPEEQSDVPSEIDRSDAVYIERLRNVFQQHPVNSKHDFDRFLDVQLLWDETMAETASLYLQAHPERKMVVLAGSGHLMYGSGIPQRVERRLGEAGVVVLPGASITVEPGVADFVLFPKMQALPKNGLLGIYMDNAEKGVLVSELSPEGAAAAAGLKKGDTLIELNGKPVTVTSDVRIELMGKTPGTPVRVQVQRKKLLWGEEQLDFVFDLGE